MTRGWSRACVLGASCLTVALVAGGCGRAPDSAGRLTELASDAEAEADVQVAALRELFLEREHAGEIVFWQDTVRDGPVFSALYAERSRTFAAPAELSVSTVTLDSLQQLFAEAPDGWEAFFERYPRAPGLVELGPVRYDAAGRQAVMLVGRTCGEHCRTAWRVALERDSVWRVAGVSPMTIPEESPGAHFLSAADLRAIGVSRFTVLDVRSGRRHRAGHLPNAVRISWLDYRDGWGRTGRLPADLDALADRLGALGVDDSRPVLVYGDARDGWGEDGRIAWMLRYLGHPAVFVLDGGMPAWRQAGGAITRDAPVVAAGQFTAQPQPSLRADIGEVAGMTSGGGVIIDTRSEGEWNGSWAYLPSRTGRIPGARHLHWSDLLTEDGRLDRSAATRRRLEALGLSTDTPIITYCVGGVRSAFVTLALRELGFRNVRNYDGSWYEWSADRSRPVESPDRNAPTRGAP